MDILQIKPLSENWFSPISIGCSGETNWFILPAAHCFQVEGHCILFLQIKKGHDSFLWIKYSNYLLQKWKPGCLWQPEPSGLQQPWQFLPHWSNFGRWCSFTLLGSGSLPYFVISISSKKAKPQKFAVEAGGCFLGSHQECILPLELPQSHPDVNVNELLALRKMDVYYSLQSLYRFLFCF